MEGYEEQFWENENPESQVNATRMTHIEKGIKNAYNVSLIAITSIEPSECNEGDKYFNTSDNLIYTATDTDTWSETGETPKGGILYVVFETNSLYAYNGTTLVGVGGSQGADKAPIGAIFEFPSNNISKLPTGYLYCDGSAISRTTYSELFAIIGTTFGTGDGSATFNLPTKEGLFSVGIDTNETDFDTIGKTGGSKYIQDHYHEYKYGNQAGGDGSALAIASTTGTQELQFGIKGVKGVQTGNSGNLPPFTTTNYIIKASKVSQNVDTGSIVDGFSSSTTDAYSCNYVNNIIDSGSNTNGSYVKYIDGTMICYNSKQVTQQVSNTWGALYTSAQVSVGTFPQEFISTPTLNVYCSGNQSIMIIAAAAPSTTSGGNIQLARADSASVTTTINYIAIGRWK